MNHPEHPPSRLPSTLWRRALVVISLALAATGTQARHHYTGGGTGEPGRFDYYVLSLSWAPTYCLTHPDDGAECSGRGYGFVLHGLWPQYDAGGYPENCPSQFELSAEAVSRGRTIYPSERLLRHEWREHGTCSGLDALGYLRAADRATASVRIPPPLEAPPSDQSLTAMQVIDLFRSANPQMPDHSMTVSCSRGELAEVHVCLTKDLAVRSCGRGVRTTCPHAAVTLPAFRKR
ncbi:MAG TPA: ribonuclease T2 [Steroidobacteraceae bacterium]|nr:ribonuclease T2 [Steroidobacteraceae bacterium]